MIRVQPSIVSKSTQIFPALKAAILVLMFSFSCTMPAIATHDPQIISSVSIKANDDQSEYVESLTWSNNSLWYLTPSEMIHEVDPKNGETRQSLPTPLQSAQQSSGQTRGITWLNGSIWVLESNYDEKSKIYKISPETAQVSRTIPISVNSPSAIASDKHSIWVANSSKIYNINRKTGKIIRSFETQVTANSLAYYQGFLWASDSSEIHQIDPGTTTGTIKSSFKVSDTFSSAVAWDNQSLWTGTTGGVLQRINVGDIGDPNSAPTASLHYSPRNPTVGSPISFSAAGSSDGSGFIRSYEWDFDGDGISDARGQKTTHTFDAAGRYSVTLKITDNNGITTEKTTSIRVTSQEPNIYSPNQSTNAANNPNKSTASTENFPILTSDKTDNSSTRGHQNSNLGSILEFIKTPLGILASILTIIASILGIWQGWERRGR